MKISSNSTLFSIERAAHEVGVSHQALRNWITAGEPVVQPNFLLNDKQPVFTREEVEKIKRWYEKPSSSTK
jgi:hypothetical protein